jgi:hypothetical protein
MDGWMGGPIDPRKQAVTNGLNRVSIHITNSCLAYQLNINFFFETATILLR